MNAVAVSVVVGREDEARAFLRSIGLDVPDGTTHWLVPVVGGTHREACETVARRFSEARDDWDQIVRISFPPES